MGKKQMSPDILYKYLNVKRTLGFLEKPSISFSSVCCFEDTREGICRSHLPCLQAERMIRDSYERSCYGIFCLSENSCSIPMWKNYTDEHEGIMVGFNSKHPFFMQNIFEQSWNKVKYTDDIPVLPEFPSLELLAHTPPSEYRDEVFEILRKAILRKDTKWEYEAEWRKRAVLSQPGDYDIHYLPQDDISDIIYSLTVGMNTSQENKTLCHKFCQQYKIDLFQADISTGEVRILAI